MKRRHLLTLIIILIWSSLLVFFFLRDKYIINEHVYELALKDAQKSFNKDVIYRKWSAMEGGVYVIPSDYTPPNPYLKVPNRDLETTEGIKLTFVNPAYMTRLVHQLEIDGNGVKGHITSLNPINPNNKPLDWEAEALQSFDEGKSEFAFLDEKESALKYMAPLVTEKSCLKCHESQGYKVGDIRGGISITVSYEPYLKIANTHIRETIIFHSIIGIIGFIGILSGSTVLGRYQSKLMDEAVKLSESEKRFKFFSESANEGIVIHNNGIIIDCNKALQEICGYSYNELIGKNILKELIHKDDLKIIKQKIAEDFQESYEINGIKKDGTIIPIEIKGFKTIFEGTEVRVASIIDLTIRKAAEQELKTSEEKFRVLIENLPIGVAMLDRDLNVITVNTMMKNIFPKSYDQNKYKCYQAFNNTELAHPCGDCTIIETFKDGKSHSLERNIINENGTRFLKIVSSPIFDFEGKVVNVIEMVEDITAFKEMNEQLQKSEERHRLLADNASDVIWTMDLKGEFTYISPSVEKLRGFTVEEIKKQKPEEFLTKNSLSHFTEGMKVIHQAVAEGKKFPDVTVELEQPCKDGSTIWTEATVTGIYKDDNTFIGILGVTRDISQRKEAEESLMSYSHELEKINEELVLSREQIEDTLYEKNILVDQLEGTRIKLEEAIKQKDKFFSIISHDLKSPFQGLLGLTNIIVEDIEGLNLKEIKEYTSLLHNSAESIYKLLENLLEWSRLQRDMIEFQITKVNLNSLVEPIIEIQSQNLKNKNISLENLVSNNLDISADVNMVTTIIRNLISNAVKYTRHNGSIVISAKDKSDSVEISVKDSGIGIPEDMLNKLFVVGEKTSRLGTDGESSTGLGLVLCKEYVEKHNGTILVESDEDKGSTFIITLPKLS
ncbi:MAG: PAS domain S-box protein [Melioribacteraceae bacterium]|nr:PAS domain S-box protein [Melioribacteraceae bacterium]